MQSYLQKGLLLYTLLHDFNELADLAFLKSCPKTEVLKIFGQTPELAEILQKLYHLYPVKD